jgi:hypothetical protein
MPVLDGKSAALLTKSEAALIRETAPAKLKAFPPARLRAKLARTRKVRDKYESLARRQSGEAKRAVQPRGARPAEGNENTTKKAEIFAAALGRIEAELDRREAAETKKAEGKAKKAAKAKKGKSAKKAKSPKKKKAGSATPRLAKKASDGKKPSSFVARNEAALSKLSQMQKAKSGLQRSSGHIAARGRRNQARRDARR